MSAIPTRRILIEPETEPVNILFHDTVIASTREALRLTEGDYPPVHYVPRDHVEMAFLHEEERRTTCPFKGEARYWSISAQGFGEENAAWAYDQPKEAAREIAGYLAFDPRKVRIAVGNEP